MANPIEFIAPARLGRSFRWLIASSWTTNISDGIALAAAPLLVVQYTSNPILVSAAVWVQRLPWLLFGLHAGVIADRLNRRVLMFTVNSLRAATVAVLVATLLSNTLSVWLLFGVLFILGAAETIADTTSQTLLPMVVPPGDLGVGNSRVRFGMVTLNRMAGPAIGAALFSAAVVYPFIVQVVLLSFGALLISRISVSPLSTGEPSTVRSDVAEGLAWIWAAPPVRTLILTLGAFNITFGAVFGILVLYVTEHLQMGPNGFGLITAVSAIGAVVGVFLYNRVDALVGPAVIMKVGLVVETVTHLVLASTTVPVIAIAMMAVFGIHEGMWGTTTSTVRLKLVPERLQGRVNSVSMMTGHSSLLIGTALGGVIASVWGVAGPFWFGFVGSALLLPLFWRRLADIAHSAPEQPE